MRRLSLALALTLALACGDDDEDDALAILASSNYVDYYATAHTDAICMDDLLAREDRFIEAVAAALGIDPPTGRIRHYWVAGSEFDDPSSWPCERAMHCYGYDEERDLGTILSAGYVHFHELVHAVEVPAFGDGHRTLGEGVAEYLGSFTRSDPVLADFPASFRNMLAASPKPSDYRLAMHFVGSLLERHGRDKLARLRRAMPAEADLDEFAAVFADVYGVPLDAALAEMTTPVHGKLVPPGCGDDVEQLPWTGDNSTEVDLSGRCGDPGFVAAGGPFFFKVFAIDIPADGMYRLTTTAPDGPPPDISVAGCPDLVASSHASTHEGLGEHPLRAGRHAVSVLYEPVPELRGEARLAIEYLSPLPP